MCLGGWVCPGGEYLGVGIPEGVGILKRMGIPEEMSIPGGGFPKGWVSQRGGYPLDMGPGISPPHGQNESCQ